MASDLMKIRQLENIIGKKIPVYRDIEDRKDGFGEETIGVVYKDHDVIKLALEIGLPKELVSIPEPILQLNALECLYLKYNEIRNFGFLSNLKSLRQLDLSFNQLDALPRSLGELKSLEVLILEGNQFKTFPLVLLELKSLQTLNFDRNQLKELPPSLRELESLTTLDLSENQLKIIPDPVLQLKSLKNLRLSGYGIKKVEEIEGLEDLTHLRKIELDGNSIKQIRGLENFTNLESLILSENQIEEISGLEHLMKLSYLSLQNNKVTEIRSLNHLKGLQSLHLGYNKISKITGLDELINLHVLDLHSNIIKKIEELESLTNLKELDLGFNKILDIKGLENLTNLQDLRLGANQISKIRGLETLKNLQKLDLANNQIVEVKGLERLINLKEVHFFGNPLRADEQKFTKFIDILAPNFREKYRQQARAIVKYCQEKKRALETTRKYLIKIAEPSIYDEITFETICSRTGISPIDLGNLLEEMLIKGEIYGKIRGTTFVFKEKKPSLPLAPPPPISAPKKAQLDLTITYDLDGDFLIQFVPRIGEETKHPEVISVSSKFFEVLNTEISSIYKFYERARSEVQKRDIQVIEVLQPDQEVSNIEGLTILEKLEVIGKKIYQQLFPSSLKQYIQAEQISTIIINSQRYLIPFELMNDGDSFLATRITFYRNPILLIERPKISSKAELQPIRVVFFTNPTGDLPNAEKETVRIIEFFNELIELKVLVNKYKGSAASYEALLKVFYLPRLDIFHYCGHSEITRDTIQFYLEDDSFPVNDVALQYPTFFFLNMCESDVNVHRKIAFKGKVTLNFPMAIMQRGAQACIATLWPILDSSAAQFALNFYREALKGVSFGDAVRSAKANLFETSDPNDITWLSFILYGMPEQSILPFLQKTKVREPLDIQQQEVVKEETISEERESTEVIKEIPRLTRVKYVIENKLKNYLKSRGLRIGYVAHTQLIQKLNNLVESNLDKLSEYLPRIPKGEKKGLTKKTIKIEHLKQWQKELGI